MSTLNGNGRVNGHHNRLKPDFDPMAPDRPVPHNLDAERCILSAMLIDNDVIAELRGDLAPKHFFRAAHEKMYRAILMLHARGEKVDGVTLAQELEHMGWFDGCGGDDGLADVANAAPHALHARAHADIVIGMAQKRALIEFHAQNLRQAWDPTVRIEPLLERSREALSQIDKGLKPIETGEDDAFLARLEYWPKPIDEPGWYGLAGEFVRAIDPFTEADPAAILVQLLTAMGNFCGRRPHWRVEASRHHLNLFMCVVGRTSKARKGTSFNHVGKLLTALDVEYAEGRLLSGISSGEGLIVEVADDINSGGAITPGIADKRLLWVEEEFANLLIIMAREGNTLGGVIRVAWDGKPMASRSKNRPVRSMKPHVSVIGHITFTELDGLMNNVQAANGFGNRFLWVCAERTKLLPEGKETPDELFDYFAKEFRHAREWADFELPGDGCLERSRDAAPLWRQIYHELSYSPPGMLGAITSRAEPQVMRIASIYALLDRDRYIRPAHLEAAYAVWRYCFDSARYIFGQAMGDPKSEKLLKALAAAGESGMTRTEIIRDVYQNHIPAPELDALLAKLIKGNLVILVEAAPQAGGKGKRSKVRVRLKDLPQTA